MLAINSLWMRSTYVLAFAVAALAGTQPALAVDRHAKVELLPSVAAIAPGQPFQLAVRFELDEGWHIYWKNGGDAGLPPTVRWSLPDGFEVGELHFPAPKLHVDPGDIVSNILEGEPVLLATVTPPARLDSHEIFIAADIQYLICKDKCIRENAAPRVTLEVLPGGIDPASANEEIIRSAQRDLPRDASDFLTVQPSLSTTAFPPGTEFELFVDVDIKKGFHVQANKPSHEAFIPTQVFLEPVAGIEFGRAVYPEPTTREVPVLGKLLEYHDRVRISVPAKVYEAVEGTPQFAGILKYQACDKDGKCFPPEAVNFQVKGDAPMVQVAEAALPSSSPTEVAGSTEEPVEEQGSSLQSTLLGWGLPGILLGCFLYGLAINLTPCVLPLLSIKVLGFVQQAHESRARTLALGLAFGAGAMIFFIVLGLLAAAGKNVLHNPVAVIVLGATVMALALSLLGVWTLQAPSAAASLEASIRREGVLASFGKGVLAPVLGFACTAPFMAAALAAAANLPRSTAIVAFLVMGLGMASPYMLLGANPRWLSFLPKPGNWMITFERIMGFVLLGMVVWLISPLTVQIGPDGFKWTLIFLVAVGLACWIWGQVQWTMPAGQRFRIRGLSAATVAVAAVVIYGWVYPIDQAVSRQESLLAAGGGGGQKIAGWTTGIPWQPWSPEAVHDAVCSGRTVFVDFTAATCTQCKVNKAVAIETDEVREKMKALDIVPLKADFSLGSEAVAAALKKYSGVAAVPLNLIYRPGHPEEPIKLDTVLTKEYLLEKLEQAGPSRALLAAAPACLN